MAYKSYDIFYQYCAERSVCTCRQFLLRLGPRREKLLREIFLTLSDVDVRA